MVLSDGRVLNNAEEIHEAALDFYRDFLTKLNDVERCDLLDTLDRVISEEDNVMLCNEPSEGEIKDAIFSFPKQSSLNPDGFGLDFFRTC